MQDLAYIVRDSVIPYINANAKHVLDHLASREGENGEAWPSAQTIADCTCISVKGVQRAINCLLENRLITRTSGKLTGRSNHYKVTLPLELIQIYAEKHPNKRIKVGQIARSEVGQSDLPPVGHRDPGGRTSAGSGVGHPDLRSKTLMSENKTTQTQKDVSSSVSLCHPPIATNRTPPKSGGVDCGNGAVTKAPQGELITRLPNGRFKVDRIHAAYTCWQVGVSNEEAYKFWRYNQTRGWPLLATMALIDIARRWRDKWQHEHPDEFNHEYNLRLEAKRRREKEALEAAYAAQLGEH